MDVHLSAQMETRVYGRSATRVKRRRPTALSRSCRGAGCGCWDRAAPIGADARSPPSRAPRRRERGAQVPVRHRRLGIQAHRVAELGDRFRRSGPAERTRCPECCADPPTRERWRPDTHCRRPGGPADPSRGACGPSPPPTQRRHGRGGPDRYRGRPTSGTGLPSTKHVGHHASTCFRSTIDDGTASPKSSSDADAIFLDRTIVADRRRRPGSRRRASAPSRRTCRRFPARCRDRPAPGPPATAGALRERRRHIAPGRSSIARIVGAEQQQIRFSARDQHRLREHVDEGANHRQRGRRREPGTPAATG